MAVQLASLYQTTLLIKDHEDTAEMDAALENAILTKRNESPEGIERSNLQGCWHSDDNLLKWTGPAGDKLAGLIRQQVARYAEECYATKKGGGFSINLASWAMVTGDRGYSTVHTHPGCHLACVYYPRDAVASEETGQLKIQPGALEFVDTRANTGLSVPGLRMSPAHRLLPKKGRMVVFPAWLPHFVHPLRGDELRISIACNATIVKYQPPKAEEETSNAC